MSRPKVQNVQPQFQPVICSKKSELPKGSVPVETGAPTHVVVNRFGVSGYTSEGCENYWGIRTTNWRQDALPSINEVVCNLENNEQTDAGSYAHDSKGAKFFIPPHITPNNFAGIKYFSSWSSKQVLTPRIVIYPRHGAIEVQELSEGEKSGFALGNYTPNFNDPRFCWCSCTFRPPMAFLKNGQSMNVEEWQAAGYFPLPNTKRPLLLPTQVVPIRKDQGIAIEEKAPETVISHYCTARNRYCTTLQNILKLDPDQRQSFGLPKHLGNITPATWFRQSSEDIFEAPLNQVVTSDIVLHQCKIDNSGIKVYIHLKKDIARLPSVPLSGSCQNRQAYLSAQRFDPTKYQAVLGRANQDAEVWITEGVTPNSVRKQHVLPSGLGKARLQFQSKVRPQVEHFKRQYPQIHAPELDKPQEVQEYLRACRLLESGQAIHIPPRHELHDLFIPWHTGVKKFNVLPLPVRPSPHKIPPAHLYVLAAHDKKWTSQIKGLIQTMDEPDRTIYEKLVQSL